MADYKKAMEEFFKKADVNNDENLDYAEVEKILGRLQFSDTHEAMEKWFPGFDESSKITFDQFWKGVCEGDENVAEERNLELHMRWYFLKHDVNQNGMLEKDECINALMDCGFTREVAEENMGKVDYEGGEGHMEGDGKLNINEFLTVVVFMPIPGRVV